MSFGIVLFSRKFGKVYNKDLSKTQKIVLYHAKYYGYPFGYHFINDFNGIPKKIGPFLIDEN